ncbi:hypothetical protein MUO93_05000 [Candidatus Bathyarchaeota archaeon]|jgi:hypothetical protein|nr:hypothetical protein [Candidatus Bathyarchaeota archaeon]
MKKATKCPLCSAAKSEEDCELMVVKDKSGKEALCCCGTLEKKQVEVL